MLQISWGITVLVSALHKSPSYPYDIISLIDNETIIPLLHSEIVEEYYEVLRRPKFHFTIQQVEDLLSLIALKSVFLEKQSVEENLPDPKDRVFMKLSQKLEKTKTPIWSPET